MTTLVYKQGIPTEPGDYYMKRSRGCNAVEYVVVGEGNSVRYGMNGPFVSNANTLWYSQRLDIKYEERLPVPKCGVATDSRGVEWSWVDRGFCSRLASRYLWANTEDYGSGDDREEFLDRLPSLTESDLHPA